MLRAKHRLFKPTLEGAEMDRLKYTQEIAEAAVLEMMLKESNEYLQAQVDALMLEYCPEEMTPEQISRWEDSQKLSNLNINTKNLKITQPNWDMIAPEEFKVVPHGGYTDEAYQIILEDGTYIRPSHIDKIIIVKKPRDWAKT